jgi:hypothetical protein
MTPSALLPRCLAPRIWWWFAAAVCLHFLAWTAWFLIAAQHPVADVPLAVPAHHP